MSVFRNLDSFHELIGDSGSRFSRSSESSFSILAVESLVWPRGYHVDVVLECNSFEIALGLLWDCLDLERITSSVSKSGSLAILFQIAENLFREIPLLNSVHAEAAFWFSRLSRSVTAVLLPSTRMMRRKGENQSILEEVPSGSIYRVMIDIVFIRATGRTSSRRTRRDPNGKINGNVNINSFSLLPQ